MNPTRNPLPQGDTWAPTFPQSSCAKSNVQPRLKVHLALDFRFRNSQVLAGRQCVWGRQLFLLDSNLMAMETTSYISQIISQLSRSHSPSVTKLGHQCSRRDTICLAAISIDLEAKPFQCFNSLCVLIPSKSSN